MSRIDLRFKVYSPTLNVTGNVSEWCNNVLLTLTDHTRLHHIIKMHYMLLQGISAGLNIPVRLNPEPDNITLLILMPLHFNVLFKKSGKVELNYATHYQRTWQHVQAKLLVLTVVFKY